MLCLIVYLGTIGTLPLLGKDEPRYVEIAREMWLRGDWITPRLGGQTWFEKPALLYWLITVSFHLFGVSEWAARLGPACCGLGTVGLIFWVGQRVEHKSVQCTDGLALWSALTSMSALGLIAFSHGATFDIVLTAMVALTLSCFFVSELEDNPQERLWPLVGLWVGVGLSLLAKGLVGIILPGGIILTYFLMRGDWRGLRRLKLSWGFPLALAVAALWYAPVIARHGQPFIDEFFIQHHFARYLSDKYRHSQPVYFYLPVIAILTFPWTGFLLSALGETKASLWRGNDALSKLRVFALAWLVLPVAFFSLSGSKLFGYVLPSVPGAMLLIGLSVAAYARGAGGVGPIRLTGGLMLLLGSGMILYAQRSGAMTGLSSLIVALPLIVVGIVAGAQAAQRVLCVGLVAGAMLLATGLVAGTAGVPLGESKSVHALLRAAEARGYQHETVWQMNTLQRTAEFYAAGRLLYNTDGEPRQVHSLMEIAKALSPAGVALVIIPRTDVPHVIRSRALLTEPLGENGDVALVLVRASRLRHAP